MLNCESTAHASERSVFAVRVQECLMERGRNSGSIITILKEVSVKTRLEKSGWKANVSRHLRLRLASTILISNSLFGPCIYSLKGIKIAAFLSGDMMQLTILRM